MDVDAAIALVASMPMRFNGLVVETTNRCNARCAMCYQSAGPKGSDELGSAKIDLDVLKRCVREATHIPTLTPRFHLAGGEAFIHLAECLELFETARSAGYLDITATTNAYWARRPESAHEIAAQLRCAGVTSLEISWDHWHKPYIPAEAIGHCLVACREHDIETNLRILTTKSHGLAEALSVLPLDALAAAHRITNGPVFATGRASQAIPAEDIHASNHGYQGTCHAVLNLTVNSFGNVFPCCAGFDQTKNYLFGNIHEEGIVDIAARLNADPIARTVVFLGAGALMPILKRAGIDLGEDFKNMCQLCWTVFSSKPCVDALQDHRQAASQRALARLIEPLENIALEA